MNTVTAESSARSRNFWSTLRTIWEQNSMVAILLLIFLLGAVISNGISAHPSNIINVLTQVAIAAVVAIGQCLVMLTGGIDLSVGPVVILTGIVLGGTTTNLTTSMIPHIGLVPGIMLGIAVAVVFGLVTGLIVSFTRIPPFITTLGMSLIVIGCSFLVTGGIPIYNMSPWFAEFGRMKVWVIPYPVILWILLMILAHIFLTRTGIGKQIYAVGGSEKTAYLSGIPIRRVKILVYMLSGLFAGIGGFLYIVRTYMMIPSANAGAEYVLDPIAACVVGGVSLTGGRGSIKNTFVGVLILAFVTNLMNILLIPPGYQTLVKGAIIIIAVVVNTNLNRSEG
jgi:ribose/xylose/arabinose/galactoside ABC-type transport system permease subunit